MRALWWVVLFHRAAQVFAAFDAGFVVVIVGADHNFANAKQDWKALDGPRRAEYPDRTVALFVKRQPCLKPFGKK